MRTFLITVMCLFTTSSVVLAQKISQQLIASSGGTHENGGVILSWSLGEPVIETFTSNNIILTQGFHQSFIVEEQTNVEAFTQLDVKVYPNPAGEYINIDMQSEFPQELTIELYNLSGEKLLIKKEIVINPLNVFHLKNIPPGTYILKLYQQEKMKSYKIIKL